MNRRTRQTILGGGALAIVAAGVAFGDGERHGEAPPTTRADSVREFSLVDIDGKSHALSEWRESKVVVLAWSAPGCPIATVYAPRLAEVAKSYEERSVRFVGVDSNAGESVDALKTLAKGAGWTFPVLLDRDGALAERVGARTTTTVAVLDGNRRVRYRGAVDDQYGIGGRKSEPGRRFLVDAIEAVLAAKSVSPETTDAPGCAITFARLEKPTTSLTWNKDVAPILRGRCATCHRLGRIGPFALETFDDAHSRTAMIKEVVTDGRMPPWHADAPRGTFSNDTRLEDAEKATLLSWVDGGAPEGDPKDAPPPPAARLRRTWHLETALSLLLF